MIAQRLQQQRWQAAHVAPLPLWQLLTLMLCRSGALPAPCHSWCMRRRQPLLQLPLPGPLAPLRWPPVPLPRRNARMTKSRRCKWRRQMLSHQPLAATRWLLPRSAG
jgi:hypothetical protein